MNIVVADWSFYVVGRDEPPSKLWTAFELKMDAISSATYLTSRAGDEENEDKPYVKSVTVPESIKRRIPSKHYVYKVVVNWTSGKKIVIYRKYTLFFDFVFKLNQLLTELSPDIQKEVQLPELPGRILFGRTEVHQVAEKRRRKVEEFCQKLIELPEEVSRSSMVLGFFNTWPADTMLRRPSIANTHIITAPVIGESPSSVENSGKILIRNSSSSSSSSIVGSASFSSPTHSSNEMGPPQQPPDSARSPSPLLSPQSQSDFSALEAIISHPDEMENLEQYLVLADYERKDSHQVNLKANQHVYVIEKHDTGWWMVMSDDEQGYAPASYLEPVEGNSSKDEHLEEGTGQVYEAMESYFAENDDEITIKAGDRIEVISKSMDGWWMIRCNGRTGLSPAALIRRRQSSSEEEEQLDAFESEKDIYEGLNIHRPPPRRNTIDHSKKSKFSAHYDIPRTSSEKKKLSRAKPNRRGSSDDRAGLLGSLTSSAVEFVDRTDHIYESQSSEPIYESTDLDDDSLPRSSGSIYENTEFMRESLKRKSSSPAKLPDWSNKTPSERPGVPRHKSTSGAATSSKKKPKHSPDDYEDPDGIMDEDYIDMDGSTDNMYIDPEDLRKGNIGSSGTSPEAEHALHNGTKGSFGDDALFDDDYIEMDPLYTEPPLESDDDDHDGTLKANLNGGTRTSPKQSPVSKRPLPPPPYSSPTPTEEKKSLTRAKSLEDIIASFNSKQVLGNGRKPDSSETKTKKVAPNPPPRVPTSSNSTSSFFIPTSSSNTHSASEQSKSSKIKMSARKLINGGSKKKEVESSPMHDKVAAMKSHNAPLERSISPSRTDRVLGRIPRPPLIHTQSTPNMDPSIPKTFVSITSYTSPARECLSFSEGDKCVLIQESPDGWWLVNIGGREGWTPGEYWREDIREVHIPKPPSFAAPRKAPFGRKPRSQTANDVFSASADLSGSSLRSIEPVVPEEDSRSFNRSMDVLSSPSKATPSLFSSSGSRSRKGPIKQTSDPRPLKPHKPIVPHKPTVSSKPTNLKQSPRTSPTPSSPLMTNRKKPGTDTPSPPPQLVESSNGMDTRDVFSTAVNGHGGVRGSSPINDYEQLDEISTIEGSPWYCGKMERTQAEQYLMDYGRQREFLIRERTSKTGFYALSVRYHFSCKHFNIDPSPDGQYVMGVLTFPSIEHIITHYQQNSLFIYDGQHVTLSQPVKKRTRPSESSRHNH